jgi:uncharacterized membrane protein
MTTADISPAIHARSGTVSTSLAPRLTLAAATLGSGLGAGLFYGYQVSVIRGLARLDDDGYVATFQALNDTIVNPWFGVVFIGTIPLVASALAFNWREPEIVKVLIASGLVLQVASLAVTAFGNIPLNNQIAEIGQVTGEAASIARADFESPWNRLHLARTLLSVASFASLAIAGLARKRS